MQFLSAAAYMGASGCFRGWELSSARCLLDRSLPPEVVMKTRDRRMSSKTCTVRSRGHCQSCHLPVMPLFALRHCRPCRRAHVRRRLGAMPAAARQVFQSLYFRFWHYCGFMGHVARTETRSNSPGGRASPDVSANEISEPRLEAAVGCLQKCVL